MAAEEKNTRIVEIRGEEYTVDIDYTESYAAFRLLKKINAKDVDAFEKLDCSYELIENAIGVDEAAIVELAGGETVKARDVLLLAIEFIQAIDQKN